jgi:flavorubredoxin
MEILIMETLKAIQISEKVYWVGAIDWGIRDFHGYSTSCGTTYNAYLILGEKPILIDTVKAGFYDEMMERISSVIDPTKISYIISNHAEMDHSGSLLRTIAATNVEQVFASKMGILALRDHFHTDFPITEIVSGESFDLGDAKFVNLETKMLHWPDSMFTYFVNDNILFSQDAFGMHLATANLFADQNDFNTLRVEAAKYFANILLPYSQFVINLLAKLPSFKLDFKMIAPAHGPIWRQQENINFILESWGNWATQKPSSKAVIVYDTMWHSTALMASAIADGVIGENVNVKVMPLSGSNRSDIATELLEAGALIVGSPTLNQQMFPTIADTLCYLKGLKRKNLIGQAFGSYGWGGEAIKLIQSELTQMGVNLVADAVNVKYVPRPDALAKCRVLGQEIGKKLQSLHFL